VKTKNYKTLSLFFLLAIFAFATQGLFSQDLVNTSTGKITNIGTIKFVAAAGEFQNANANNGLNAEAYIGEVSGSSGTILFTGTTNVFAGAQQLGAADASRIGGWVVYGSASAQTVQAGYYTSLGMEAAGTKSFNAIQVNVDHVYNVASGSGDRDYGTSTFIYDGDVAGTEDQTIFPESGSSGGNNIYATLQFENSGVKTLAQGATCNAETDIDLEASATKVVILGTMQAFGTVTTVASSGLYIGGDGDGTGGEATEDGYFKSKDGAGTLAGDVYIYNDGTYLTDGTGLQTFSGTVEVGTDGGTAANTSGSLTLLSGNVTVDAGTLDLQNVNGHIVAGAGRTLELANGFTFSNQVAYGTGVGERSNMEFAVTSTALYSGTGSILGTGKSYPYGNLTITNGSNSVIESDNGTQNVYLAGNFDLSGSDLYVDNNTDPTDASSFLAMLDPTKTVAIADGIDIRGAVRHYIESNSAGALVYNNIQTKINVTDNGANTEYMQLSAYAGGPPTASDYAAGTDVHRRFYLDWNLTSGQWTATIQAAYKAAEYTGSVDDENSLRFREYTNGGASEKISTGNSVTRVPKSAAVNGFAYASLAGITSDPSASLSLARFGDTGNEFLLRGGPTWFITIANGRWSNPATWDEGEQPGPRDMCLVRHTVHAGYVRATDNYNVSENTHLATFSKDITDLTAYIEVFSGTMGSTTYHGALMFGSGDKSKYTNDITTPTWGMNEGATLTGTYTSPSGSGNTAVVGTIDIVGNTGTASNLPTYTGGAINDQDASSVLDNGSYLLVFNGATFTITTDLTNNGNIVNAGTIELAP